MTSYQDIFKAYIAALAIKAATKIDANGGSVKLVNRISGAAVFAIMSYVAPFTLGAMAIEYCYSKLTDTETRPVRNVILNSWNAMTQGAGPLPVPTQN